MTSQDLALGSTISIRGVGPSSGDGSSLSGARLANVTRCRPIEALFVWRGIWWASLVLTHLSQVVFLSWVDWRVLCVSEGLLVERF